MRSLHHAAWAHHDTTSDQHHGDLCGCESLWLIQLERPHFFLYALFVLRLERSRGNVSIQRCCQKAEEVRALKGLVNANKFEKNPKFKQ